jgi:hypothetical protein
MRYHFNILLMALFSLVLPASGFGATLIQERFDDAQFTSRGWYDGCAGTISTAEHIPGSAGSFECRFTAGATGCAGGAPKRHAFSASKQVYMSFWIKHSGNWMGSGAGYHPHMFYFLTSLNGAYDGLAYDRLTAYVEENQGRPVLAIQDGQNIDRSKIGQNLAGVTENRAVAGCNGTQSGIGQDTVSCYPSGSVHWNGTMWKGPTAYFTDAGRKTNWHFVEAYFRLNTVSNGIGQPDGVIRYWYDGTLVIERNNIIMRTGANASMMFNQLVIAPYIGDGSPVDQRFWIDNLTVATSRPTGGSQPSPPLNLTSRWLFPINPR